MSKKINRVKKENVINRQTKLVLFTYQNDKLLYCKQIGYRNILWSDDISEAIIFKTKSLAKSVIKELSTNSYKIGFKKI